MSWEIRDFDDKSANQRKEAVALETRQLAAVLEALDAIAIPALVRPPVAFKEPPTNDLVTWAVRVYFYSVLSQFREVLRSVPLLVAMGHVPAVFLCCRSLFELAAHSYYVKKHSLQYCKAGNLGLAWQFLFEVNIGSRHVREQEGDTTTHPEGPHIGKVISCFNEYFPDGQKDKPATDTYSSLSEFSHPNCYAFTNHFDWEMDSQNNAKVIFGSPPTDVLVLALPPASLATVAFLHSSTELLRLGGDDPVAAIVGGLLKDILSIKRNGVSVD